MLQTGDVVDDFELLDQVGVPRRLRTMLADGPVVVFFYPAAMTKGCTMQSCHFRDLGAEFASVGAQRVGISGDTVEKQKEFSDAHEFDYPLLSDPEGTVAELFGVKRSIGLSPLRRSTFVIGPDRRILAAIKSEVRMNVHADKALEVLRAAAT